MLMAQRDSVYYGVSLSGAEWASSENYPSTDLLDYYQSKGLILIRLSIMWERLQPSLGGDLDPNELALLLPFVDAVAARNMKVIIDIHNYARYDGNIIGNGVSIADVTDMWTKLATQLKSKTCIYGYGIMNEPHDMLSSPTWKDIAQGIITGIRTVDQSTTIIVGGDSWSSAERWPSYSDNLKDLVDPNTNLIFEAHCYFDSDASGQYIPPTDSLGNQLNVYDAEKITTATGVNRVKPFVNWLKTNNLKGFIGEYGVPNDDSRWLNVLDTFMVYLKANQIGGAYWDCSNLNCDPYGNIDAVQMSVLEKFGIDASTNNGNPVNRETETLFVKDSVVILAGGANSIATLNIYSNTTWHTYLNSNTDWLQVNPTGSGNAPVTFIAQQNNTGQDRMAFFDVITNDQAYGVPIFVCQLPDTSYNQTIASTLSVSSNSIFIAANENSTAKVNVKSNTSWYPFILESNSWLTFSSNSTSGDGIVSLQASENKTDSIRTETIYIVATNNDVPSKVITVTQVAGRTTIVSEIPNENIAVYPNPANTYFFVSNTGYAVIELYNAIGHLVLKTEINGNEAIPLNHFVSGLYFVKINSDNNVVTKTLEVQ
jgi:endoglucanase